MRVTIISDNYAECLQRKRKAKGEGNYSVNADILRDPPLQKHHRLSMSQVVSRHIVHQLSDSLTAGIQ